MKLKALYKPGETVRAAGVNEPDFSDDAGRITFYPDGDVGIVLPVSDTDTKTPPTEPTVMISLCCTMLNHQDLFDATLKRLQEVGMHPKK